MPRGRRNNEDSEIWKRLGKQNKKLESEKEKDVDSGSNKLSMF
jgi:hypothetical protein